MGHQEAASRRISTAIDRGATVVISVHWIPGEKKWDIVGSLHSRTRAQVVRTTSANTGAPDLDDVRRMLSAIRLECESWLW